MTMHFMQGRPLLAAIPRFVNTSCRAASGKIARIVRPSQHWGVADFFLFRDSIAKLACVQAQRLFRAFSFTVVSLLCVAMTGCGSGAGGSDTGSGGTGSNDSGNAGGGDLTVTPTPPTPTSGVCGSANGISASTAPASNLCAAGTASSVLTNASSYTWSCSGDNGGAVAQCSASKSTEPVNTALPYSIPAAGQAIAIGTNTADSIKPAGISSFNWSYALFTCFGGGAFNPDYSAYGAFVIAGSGGHTCPAANVDAAIFDFSDATWKRLANANGIAPREDDYAQSELSNDAYVEILEATAGQIPAPSHAYNTSQYLPSSLSGGPKGSFLKIGSRAAAISSISGSGIHKMDLSTGLWTRATNETVDLLSSFETSVIFDPVEQRYYILPDAFHAATHLQYFDPQTNTVGSTVDYPYVSGVTGTSYQVAFLDPVRRLLLSQRPGNPLRALDLNDIAAGWAALITTGTQPSEPNRWAFYEPDGRFYTRGNNSGQTLVRLTAPADWKTGTWIYDTVTVAGASLPNFATVGDSTVRHYSTFFYVPALQSFAWVSGTTNEVIILKPPT